MKIFSFFISYCDAPEPWQMNIQDPATPALEGMLFFHNYLMFYLIVIAVVVFWFLYLIIFEYNDQANPTPQVFTHSSTLEIIWTLVPAFILILIAVPSFTLLYSLDENIDPSITLKVVGHQWYWSYEYSDKMEALSHISVDPIVFDSYMVPTDELTFGSFRLLEVDHRVVLPVGVHVRVLVTSADVLHSWAVPSFGIKIDACPGRLSQGSIFLKREGVYYGQCSEICGVNHGFMPIVVKGVSEKRFIDWYLYKTIENF